MRTRRTLVATGLVAALSIAGLTAAVANDPPPRIAFLANGIVPADALAAGPIAGQLGAPMYTTRQEALSEAAAGGLADFGPDLVIVLGGPVAIADAVIAQVEDATGLAHTDQATPAGGIVRAAGGDRFDTAAAVAALLNAYNPAYLPTDSKAIDSDRLDGKDSSAYLGASDTAANADKLDGKDSSAFLGVDQQAADSDKVDGLDANAINRVAYDFEPNIALDGTNGIAASTTIIAPTDGFLVLSGTLNLNNFSTADTMVCRLRVDGTRLANDFVQRVDGTGNTLIRNQMSLDGVEPVDAGSHDVDIDCVDVAAETNVEDTFLVVQFVPFGPDGTPPTP